MHVFTVEGFGACEQCGGDDHAIEQLQAVAFSNLDSQQVCVHREGNYGFGESNYCSDSRFDRFPMEFLFSNGDIRKLVENLNADRVRL